MHGRCAIALRDRFVVRLIPLLNPDGVYHGHYRFDTRGVNLNRAYVNASPELSPSTYACMALVAQSHGREDLLVYLDLHAHAGRRGCFFYGNVLESAKAQEDAALFAKLVALNTRWFDFDGCTWFDAAAHAGSARAAVYAITGLTHIYTLECNYDSGAYANELQPRHDANGASGRALSPEPPPPACISPKYAQKMHVL